MGFKVWRGQCKGRAIGMKKTAGGCESDRTALIVNLVQLNKIVIDFS
jgi:hypothetical protein